MSSVATLPLSDVVDVSVIVSPTAPATPQFNQGLIVGTSPVIGSVTGSNQRLRRYTSLSQMATDGFSLSSPEYLAATLYWGQNPAPIYLWIGRQDLTSLSVGGVAIGNAAGTDYLVGDIVTPTQGGATLGQIRITAVDGEGAVTGLVVVEGFQGTGYQIATNLPTTSTGGGTGLTVNITAVGETPLEAMQACRLASPDWYIGVALTATDADSFAIGQWAQSQTPQLVYFYTTGSTDALNGTVNSPFVKLKAISASRAFGLYSTTQGGLFPNNIYAVCAAMGVAMGLNTGLPNSFFTMKFKVLVGVGTNPLNETQIGVIEGSAGNCYLSFANSYQWIEQGTVASGQYFDEILNLDMLASDYQFSLVDLLTGQPAVLQSNAGQTQILNVINACNARAALRGFISPGIWNGITILNLTAGQSLPNGYLSQSASYSTQSPSDRKARKSMPVLVAIIESGAVHSISIQVTVQQ